MYTLLKSTIKIIKDGNISLHFTVDILDNFHGFQFQFFQGGKRLRQSESQ